MSKFQAILSQQKYREWSEEVSDLSIFQKAWWMDAVCGMENWQGVLVCNAQSEIIAAMAIPSGRKWGLSTRIQPFFTPHAGPYLVLDDSPDRTEIKSKTRYWEIMDVLISAFPQVHFEALHLHPSVMDCLPFHWQGYKQTTRHTFQLKMKAKDLLFNEFKGSVRTHIRKAEQTLRAELTDDIRAVFNAQNASFERKNTVLPFGFDLLEKVYQACKQYDAGRCWLVKDEAGRVQAGVFCVNDKDTAYLLTSGVDTSTGAQGAINLAYWEAIQYYSDKVQIFDFEGSMLPGVAPLFLSFGAELTPYFRVFKCSNRLLEAGLRVLGKWG